MGHDNQLARIRAEAHHRGIARLCHFTRSRSLPLIVETGAIASTAWLRERQLPHHPNDPHRLDGQPDHVSCSIQYPNVWNLDQFRDRVDPAEEWVVLSIDPAPLWWAGSLFCRRNAAKYNGGLVGSGCDAFTGMFAHAARNFGWRRDTHLRSCPTDDQAEVLITGPIEMDLVRGIVVPDEQQADRERKRLNTVGKADLPVYVCSEFFDSEALKQRRRYGPELDPSRGEV